MFINQYVGFIGGGAIAEALIRGILQAGLLQPAQILVNDVNENRRAFLEASYGVTAIADSQLLAAKADILFLTVKPNVVEPLLTTIAKAILPQTIVVSVAAGVRLAALEEKLPNNPIIRVMPNTPVAVGEGMSVLALGSRSCSEHGEKAAALFNAVGKTVMAGEELMDAVTGLSGSGPGYAFVLIDALADAGVRVGLPRQMSILLAAQTLLGAAKMVLETGEHPAKLRDAVTSPGGTTIAGIHVMEQRGVRAALSDAVAVACERSREMGKRK